MSEQQILTKLSLDLAPRPPRGMDTTLQQAAKKIADQLVDECGWAYHDELIGDLCKAYRQTYPRDGFQIAKKLDDMDYEIDAAAVEVLDNFDVHESSAYDASVREWARSVDFTPCFAVGNAVKIKQMSKIHDGFIRSVHETSWQYVVRVPELGHVESGMGTHGIYLNCEDVDKFNAELPTPIEGQNENS